MSNNIDSENRAHNVATVYNVGKIKKEALPSAKIIAVVGSKALGNTSNNNVPQNEPVVNNNSMQEAAKNSHENISKQKNNDNKYSLSVENEHKEVYNVSRANEEGDNINEFYSALDRSQWRNFYKKIAEKGYLEKKKVGDLISLVVGDKLILAERQWTGKDAHDFQVIDVYRVNDYADSYILNEIKDILDESGLYDAKSIAKIIHQFNQGNGQTEIATRFDRNNGTFRNGIASGKQEDISGTAVRIYQNQSHRSGISYQDEQHIQGTEGGISSANNSKIQYSIPTEADELLDDHKIDKNKKCTVLNCTFFY